MIPLLSCLFFLCFRYSEDPLLDIIVVDDDDGDDFVLDS